MKISFNRRSLPGWNLMEYVLLRGFAGILNALPISVSTGITRFVGDVIYWLLPDRRKTAFHNLDIAFGNALSPQEKERIAKEAFRNLATSLMEFFRMPSMLRVAVDRFEFEGTEHLDAAFKKGKGIIFVISHLGSWEYLAFLPYLRGYPCSVVVRPAKNPYIYRWIQALRQKTHLDPIDRNNAVKKLLQQLKGNRLIAILIDQWASADGLWIDFFGKPTSTTSIPARLARHLGAALIPAYCIRTTPGYYKIIIHPEVPFDASEDDATVTKRLNLLLEKEIRRYPSQWSWAHKRWKDESHYLALKKRSAAAVTS